MPKVRLIPENVAKLRPRPGRDKDVWWDDSESAPPAFGVRVRSNGSASYVIQYRTLKGIDRLMRLGKVGALTLAGARKAGKAALDRVAEGQDPALDRHEDRKAERLEDLVLDYIETGTTRRGEPRSAKTQGTYDRMFRADVKGSALGRKRPAEVTPRDVERFLEAKAADAPVVADRLHALLRATFRWALRKRRVETDPTAALDRSVGRHVRERVLTDEEVKAVWMAELDPVRLTAIRTLLLLATRLGETLRMTWGDVDLDGEVPAWTIPGSERKGGRTHAVPLPPEAVRLLEALRPTTGKHKFVFAGERGASLMHNPDRLAADLRTATGIEDMRLHDVRRTAAVGLAKAGAPTEIISRILGHALPAGTLAVTSEHYQTFDRFPERAAALAAWARRVDRIVTGEERGADILPMVRS